MNFLDCKFKKKGVASDVKETGTKQVNDLKQGDIAFIITSIHELCPKRR